MNDPDINTQKEALNWLLFAKGDLETALQLASLESYSPRHVCWLCQQAAEKAIKAALILEAVEFPLVHDLNILRELLPNGWAVLYTHGDLYDLTEWAVEARYPGNWPEPTHEDAIKAKSKARLVCDSVMGEFKRRNMFDI